MPENPMEIFRREAPEVAKAFDGLIMSLVASKGLDQKTKQLIYIAMKAAMGDEVELNEIFAGAMPFVGLMLVIAVLLAAFPPISLWLPDMMAAGK